jgi:hypothetical protein
MEPTEHVVRVGKELACITCRRINLKSAIFFHERELAR